ncbi:MAG: GGDEF domain-containing protein [Thalassospira sp.]|uniref:GGDEF domain-containing protein n=1 Tax=Thalassospira sp. GB04J01 TaxID=1485225 RepID=UPI000C0F213D|nr:GGDEF domain-containing protein [Thalassospira sp. GB04J01]MBV17164.1 GGDEF domain-containing protein [Thalassospira sp.]
MPTTEEQISRHWGYADATLKALRDRGLRPTPELYHVWFIYFAAENPEILRVIDAVNASGDDLAEDTLLQLYYRYIFDRQAADFLQRGMEDFSQVVENSDECLTSARNNIRSYGELLKSSLGTLRAHKDVGPVVGEIVDQTEEMKSTIDNLHVRLDGYLNRVVLLQRELEQTRERSYTDGLTRVSNRMHFEEQLSQLAKEYDSSEDAEPFCVMMVDLDQFKSINDRFGHRIGDEILVLIASMLKANIKGRDIVARYGGDEFAILLPQTSLDDAMEVAADMSKRIAAREIKAKNSGTSYGHMTVSVGAAEYVAHEGGAKLIDRADSALYRAKKDGRNRHFAAE